jgi:hypothetical protein
MIEERHGLASCPPIPRTEATETAIYPFFADPSRHALILWVDGGEVRLADRVPDVPVDALAYFLKTDKVTVTPADDFSLRVHHGTIRGASHVSALVDKMDSVFVPLFESTSAWPRSVQSDFAAR